MAAENKEVVMGSMARKLKRQQPALKAPYAKPIPKPTPELKKFGSDCYDQGFERGYRAAYGYMMANMAYIWKYHENIFDNPSNRLQIYFQLMKLFSEEYVQYRTPKMLAALDDLRRQGIDVEIKGDISGIYSK